ncbi:hypothetical protein MRX96_059850 [Rhipicephalus microplus]
MDRCGTTTLHFYPANVLSSELTCSTTSKKVFTHTLLVSIGLTFFSNWRNTYALHTWVNHREVVPEDPLNSVELNETNIRNYDTAMGQMARSVIFGTSEFVGPQAPILSVSELAAMKDRGGDLTQIRNESTKPLYVLK